MFTRYVQAFVAVLLVQVLLISSISHAGLPGVQFPPGYVQPDTMELSITNTTNLDFLKVVLCDGQNPIPDFTSAFDSVPKGETRTNAYVQNKYFKPGLNQGFDTEISITQFDLVAYPAGFLVANSQFNLGCNLPNSYKTRVAFVKNSKKSVVISGTLSKDFEYGVSNISYFSPANPISKNIQIVTNINVVSNSINTYIKAATCINDEFYPQELMYQELDGRTFTYLKNAIVTKTIAQDYTVKIVKISDTNCSDPILSVTNKLEIGDNFIWNVTLRTEGFKLLQTSATPVEENSVKISVLQNDYPLSSICWQNQRVYEAASGSGVFTLFPQYYMTYSIFGMLGVPGNNGCNNMSSFQNEIVSDYQTLQTGFKYTFTLQNPEESVYFDESYQMSGPSLSISNTPSTEGLQYIVYPGYQNDLDLKICVNGVIKNSENFVVLQSGEYKLQAVKNNVCLPKIFEITLQPGFYNYLEAAKFFVPQAFSGLVFSGDSTPILEPITTSVITPATSIKTVLAAKTINPFNQVLAFQQPEESVAQTPLVQVPTKSNSSSGSSATNSPTSSSTPSSSSTSSSTKSVNWWDNLWLWIGTVVIAISLVFYFFVRRSSR